MRCWALNCTIHNLRYYQKPMADLREAIAEGRLDAFADEFYAKQATENPRAALWVNKLGV